MKLFVINSKTVFSIVFIVLITATACLGLTAVKAASAARYNGITIVLDAGHGGIDGGVSGVSSGVKESDINLKITKILRHYLKERGYQVVLTRKDSVGLYDVTAKSKKLSDMQKRKEIINGHSPDLMISIHQNSYPLSTVNGAQVFYADNNEKSSEIAKTFQAALNTFEEHNKTEKKADYYVLQCSPYPSILIECGFLSNPDDEQKLLTSAYRERLAKVLADTVDKIFFLEQET